MVSVFDDGSAQRSAVRSLAKLGYSAAQIAKATGMKLADVKTIAKALRLTLGG